MTEKTKEQLQKALKTQTLVCRELEEKNVELKSQIKTIESRFENLRLDLEAERQVNSKVFDKITLFLDLLHPEWNKMGERNNEPSINERALMIIRDHLS